METMGLYIHVPFCEKKCPYCDFYSLTPEGGAVNTYRDALLRDLAYWVPSLKNKTVDSVYFGGGTPPLLGAKNIAAILDAVRNCCDLKDPEITTEANPGSISGDDLCILADAGVNRVSFGLQSAEPGELQSIGRRHSPEDAALACSLARQAGIRNISLDVMLGLPGQTTSSVDSTLVFAFSQNITHLSAYLLKVEEGTAFYNHHAPLPHEEEVCDIYDNAVHKCKSAGYDRYEISNFAKKGYECRHNLHYWRCDEYLGLGPSAHSFLNGKRFYYPRDLKSYLQGSLSPMDDGEGGGFDEWVMLGLRLTEGIDLTEMQKKWPGETRKLLHRAEVLAQQGFVMLSAGHLALAPDKYLISNVIISKLLFG